MESNLEETKPVYVFNSAQTQLTEEVLNSLTREARQELFDNIEGIEFVKRLISPHRKRAKDLEKDSKGRVKVELTNPHLLEDMDYFRPAALMYQKTGKYCHYFPSTNPNSQYVRFWKEEARRCVEGYVRESDGEWITGYHYYYLNYSPIMRTKAVGEGKRAERVYDFPDFFDGDYLYFHYLEQAEEAGQHGSVLKTRGRGFSFKGGAMIGRNMELLERSSSFAMAFEKEYLTKDGILTKAWQNLDWIATETPLPSRRLKNTDMEKILGYTNLGTEDKKGILTLGLGVSLKDDPDRARGKRGKIILFEESGKFPGLEKAWGICRMSVENADDVFGLMIAFGTGGTEGADFEALNKFFYFPLAYNILALPNVFDRNVDYTKSKCGFFSPEYMNRARCYDKNGNSDVIKAIIQVVESRDIVRKHQSDPRALTQEKADRCLTPQEAVMRIDGTVFPVADIGAYLETIRPDINKFVAGHFKGRLVVNELGEVEWKNDISAYVIRKFPIAPEDKREGAVEIFEMPKNLESTGKPPLYRYIAGIDPVDDDEAPTSISLCSIFIFDTFTERIVAEYTGRPQFSTDFYEMARRLLIFYNAIANYENDKKGLYVHFAYKNSLHLLADNPRILQDMQYIRGYQIGNKRKGTPSNKKVNSWGRLLQAEWMMRSSHYDPNLLNLHTIRSTAYLEECLIWNPDSGNYDRVSAMGMCLILFEDVKKYVMQLKSDDTSSDPDDIYHDEWFDRNVGEGHQQLHGLKKLDELRRNLAKLGYNVNVKE